MATMPGGLAITLRILFSGERLQRASAAFAGLEFRRARVAGSSHANRKCVTIERINAQDALAAIAAAVGDHVDCLRLFFRIKLDLCSGKASAIASQTTWSSLTIRLIDRTTSSGAF